METQTAPTLCANFNAAARNFREGMKTLISEAAAGRLKLPQDDVACWISYSNNCYNFAINRCTGDFLQPGRYALGDDYEKVEAAGDIKKYAAKIHKNALKDGLRFLGQDFTAVAKRTDVTRPVALFFRREYGVDYHWFSLRRKRSFGTGKPDAKDGGLVWAHKQGARAAEICGVLKMGKRGECQDIFAAAKAEHYELFGGYYDVPLDLEQVATPPEFD